MGFEETEAQKIEQSKTAKLTAPLTLFIDKDAVMEMLRKLVLNSHPSHWTEGDRHLLKMILARVIEKTVLYQPDKEAKSKQTFEPLHESSRYHEKNGGQCDMTRGPCACGAWH